MAAKKKFFEVEIPLTNSSAELLAYNIQELANKTIKLDLTRQLRGKSIEVVFQVQIENNKAIAEPRRLTLLSFFIRRMLRKSISYAEDSFSAECKDAFLKVKPFLITRKVVSRRVRKALREEAINWLIDYIKNKSYNGVFSEIIGNRLQKLLSLKLKKIYPLALCEIRILKVEKLKEQEKLKVTVEKVGLKEVEEKALFGKEPLERKEKEVEEEIETKEESLEKIEGEAQEEEESKGELKKEAGAEEGSEKQEEIEKNEN